jgi:endonuclease-3
MGEDVPDGDARADPEAGADANADAGTYTLLVELVEAATVEFGAAGPRDLQRGWYAYVGSALGPGGFARIDRHRRLAAGDGEARHWHVDYLLGHPDARVDGVVRSPGADVECAVGAAVRAAGDPVPGIGATDCGCSSHLVYGADGAKLLAAVERAHENAREQG